MTRFDTPAEITAAASALRHGNPVDTGLKTARYVRVRKEDAAELYAAIVTFMQENGEGEIRTLGRYVGYSGGGAYEEGVFIVDAGADDESVVIQDPDEIEAHPDAAVFQWLTVECGRLFEVESDGYLVSEAASELIDEEEVYMDDDFFGDLLAEVSEQWGLNLRFED